MQEEKNLNEAAECETVAETEKNTDTEVNDTQDAACEKESRGDRKKVKKLESEIEALRHQLQKAEERAAAAEDKYMRMIAEYDNFRKRSVKERESCYADAHADAVNAVLPVLDNLERAAVYSDAEAVAKGLELTLKSFSETFSKLGICEIEALGKTFDPNVHNAVMHVEDEAYGENEIVEVLQKGYIKGDRVIRYAMVKVAN